MTARDPRIAPRRDAAPMPADTALPAFHAGEPLGLTQEELRRLVIEILG
jgi:hypothetical protein